MDYIAIWKNIFHFEAVGVTDYYNIIKLVELSYIFVVPKAKLK